MRTPGRGRTVAGVRFLLIALLGAIVLGLAGWGVVIKRVTDHEGDVQRSRPANTAEVEACARFKLPPSATTVKIEEHEGIDYSVRALFEIDPADVDAFVDSTGLDVTRTGRTLRAEEGMSTPGYSRQFIVIVHPDHAVVDIYASEL